MQDVLPVIFRHLNISDVPRVSTVCKSWNRAVQRKDVLSHLVRKAFCCEALYATNERVNTRTNGTLQSLARMRPRDHTSCQLTGCAHSWPVFVDFADMHLQPALLRGILAYGFERPSTVQQRAIVPMMLGKDVVIQSAVGTGRSSTFVIGSLQRIDYSLRKVQVLALTLSRELSSQLASAFSSIGSELGVEVLQLVGGANAVNDAKKLQQDNQLPHVIVGTPGRVLLMITSSRLDLRHLQVFIVTEAAQLLDMGNRPELARIAKHLSPRVQTAISCATMGTSLLDLVEKITTSPARVVSDGSELRLDGIRQYHVVVEREAWKIYTLCDLYSCMALTQSTVFCNSRGNAERLSQQLQERGFSVSLMYEAQTSAERKVALRAFRAGQTRVMVATDAFAGGIDVSYISCSINYDLPAQPDLYLRRSGRRGRFGRTGLCISFVTDDDIKTLRNLELYFRINIAELPADIDTLV